jgi:purine nucleoside phosphorylase
MPELQNIREIEVDTPFGKPSDAFIVGELEERESRVFAQTRART